MSLFGLYFHRSMLYSSTKVATRRFVRHLENLGTMTPVFNDIYFESRVMSQLGGCTVVSYLTREGFRKREILVNYKRAQNKRL